MPKLTLQSDVGDFYCRLWEEIETISGHDIISQFLYNVDLPPEWFNGKKCLDVGCGSGFAMWVMEYLGAECYACDISMESLLQVRKKIRYNQCVHRILNASVLSLPFPSERFDFVHCNGVLHHTLNPISGFSELVRVTSKGGQLFVSVYGKGGVYNHAVGIARIFARIIPYSVTERIADIFLKNKTVPSSFIPAKVSLLDNMYVPIRHSYKECEILAWFEKEGFDPKKIKRTKTTIYDHEQLFNRLVHGDGYLQFRASKPWA